MLWGTVLCIVALFLVPVKVSSFHKWVKHTERFLPTDFIIFSFWKAGISNDPNDTESILIITLPLRAERCPWKNFLNFLINLQWLYFAQDCALKPLWDILYVLPQSSFRKNNFFNYTIKKITRTKIIAIICWVTKDQKDYKKESNDQYLNVQVCRDILHISFQCL